MKSFVAAVRAAMPAQSTATVGEFLRERSRAALDRYPGRDCLRPNEFELLLGGESEIDEAMLARRATHLDSCAHCRRLFEHAKREMALGPVLEAAAAVRSQPLPLMPKSLNDVERFQAAATECALQRLAQLMIESSEDAWALHAAKVLYSEASAREATQKLVRYSVTGLCETVAYEYFCNYVAMILPALIRPEPTWNAIFAPRDELGTLVRAAACRLRVQQNQDVPAALLEAFRPMPSSPTRCLSAYETRKELRSVGVTGLDSADTVATG